ncbi:hypothetical protein PR048_008928 [Dryococelus australis]|uniref:Uncharacterized protein n=1 Tax=Dryococelus australis TaxID=614101 RepID=A0ABQ9HYI9_9NEOP|nr:hypothetical protein PR048_008928 [Dryococelus australis]
MENKWSGRGRRDSNSDSEPSGENGTDERDNKRKKTDHEELKPHCINPDSLTTMTASQAAGGTSSLLAIVAHSGPMYTRQQGGGNFYNTELLDPRIQRSRYYKTSKLIELETGTLVLVRDVSVSKLWDFVCAKLFRIYNGPYAVMGKNNYNHHVLANPVTGERLGSYNFRQSKPYNALIRAEI